jgi:hypothetical protein
MQGNRLRSPELTGKANCSGAAAPEFAPAGIRSRLTQSVAGLWLAHRLDWIARCLLFQESSRPVGYISARPHRLALRVASL